MKESVRQRDGDQRRARTYGLHFTDYFPRRELGIAYYNLNNYPEAISQLEMSLEQTPSARAKYYLNKARRQSINESGSDTQLPQISVTFPPPQYVTNAFSLDLEAAVSDDTFLEGVALNSTFKPLELSARRIALSESIALKPGKNNITLQARDLNGKQSQKHVIKVTVDREGPLSFLSARLNADNTILISGGAYDQAGITRITINGIEKQIAGLHFIKISETITADSLQGVGIIPYRIYDRAGNLTSGVVSFSQSSAARQPGAQLASASDTLPLMQLPRHGPEMLLAAVVTHDDSQGRNFIDLKGLTDGQTFFSEKLFIEGSVNAPAGVQDLMINGRSFIDQADDADLVNFLMELVDRKSKNLSFSKIIPLQEGENRITVTLVDADDDKTEKTITVIKKTPQARQIGSRLTVTVCPFKMTTQAEDSLTDYVQSFLTSAFVNQGRFNMLERSELNRLLDEQQMSQEDIFDQQTAVSLGRMLASETILAGDIFASENSVEIVARLIDTETSLILAEQDVYWEGTISKGFRDIIEGLALKFKQKLPLVEGTIIQSRGDNIMVDLGSEHNIIKGMRMLAFAEGEPIIHPATGEVLDTDTELLALLTAGNVRKKFSKTKLLKSFTEQEVKVLDKVITK
ncbi:MAG: hypothetical protein GY868_14875 [Deltaproteobacteria bacterium]|nr:hypothetical protein [Deltaproteobacteria bacterium]